jgi:hypothetical protein
MSLPSFFNARPRLRKLLLLFLASATVIWVVTFGAIFITRNSPQSTRGDTTTAKASDSAVLAPRGLSRTLLGGDNGFVEWLLTSKFEDKKSFVIFGLFSSIIIVLVI